MFGFGSNEIAATLLALCICSCASKDQNASQDEKQEHPAAPSPTTDKPAVADAMSPAQGTGDLGYGDDAKLFDSPADAMKSILAQEPQILGFGEYHKLTSSAKVQSALRRFADEMLDVVGPHTEHLILETWSVDPSCGAKGKEVSKRVEETIERPEEVENEMQTLMRKSQEYGIRGHVLGFTCKEYAGLLNKKKSDPGGVGALNTERLLETVSKKLGEAALMAWKAKKSDKMVVVYGGATHNNLYPYPGLEAWSYAQDLAKQSGASYVEVDLYVPELVAGDTLLSQEAWYPLLNEARKHQVILIRRDASSYILIMRKEYAELDGQENGKQGAQEDKSAGQNNGTANP